MYFVDLDDLGVNFYVFWDAEFIFFQSEQLCSGESGIKLHFNTKMK